jgi:hypothetical protein
MSLGKAAKAQSTAIKALKIAFEGGFKAQGTAFKALSAAYQAPSTCTAFKPRHPAFEALSTASKGSE